MNTKEKQRHLHTVDRSATQRKRPVRRERKLKDSDVVYTPPKPFKRGRFILHLVTVAGFREADEATSVADRRDPFLDIMG